MPQEIVLRTHQLTKNFGRRRAVDSLDLSVLRGEVYGFLGPNGAGKSTTIRMMLSLVAPTSGSVELFGKPLLRYRAETLRRVGGLVEKADFYLYLSARKNLEIVGGLRGDISRSEIDRALETVGLRDRAEDHVKTFSHGMKQRLGIAQALLGSPELVVLDEPTSGLDPQGIKEVRELIGRLCRDRGMTVFLSSHLLHEIEQTATSMAIINRGRLVVQGAVRDLLSEEVASVRFEADPVDRAREAIAGLTFVTDVRFSGGSIDVRLPQDRIAEVNRLLVQLGIRVRAIVPRRSLEEYFLSLTEGASDGETKHPEDRPRLQ
jgi:ABC-type multidrug transport system ATPase subunit